MHNSIQKSHWKSSKNIQKPPILIPSNPSLQFPSILYSKNGSDSRSLYNDKAIQQYLSNVYHFIQHAKAKQGQNNAAKEVKKVTEEDMMLSYSLSQSQVSSRNQHHENCSRLRPQIKLSISKYTQNDNCYLNPQFNSRHMLSSNVALPNNDCGQENYNSLQNSNLIFNQARLLKRQHQRIYESEVANNLQTMFGIEHQSRIVEQEEINEEINDKGYKMCYQTIGMVMSQVEKITERVQKMRQNKEMQNRNSRKERFLKEDRRSEKQNLIMNKQKVNMHILRNENPKILQNKHQNRMLSSKYQQKSNITQKPTSVQPIEEIKGLKNEDEQLLVQILLKLGYIKEQNLKINNNNYNTRFNTSNKLTELIKQAKYTYFQKQIQKNMNKMRVKQEDQVCQNESSQHNSEQDCVNNNFSASIDQNLLQTNNFPKVPSMIANIDELREYAESQCGNNNVENVLQYDSGAKLPSIQKLSMHLNIDQPNHNSTHNYYFDQETGDNKQNIPNYQVNQQQEDANKLSLQIYDGKKSLYHKLYQDEQEEKLETQEQNAKGNLKQDIHIVYGLDASPQKQPKAQVKQEAVQQNFPQNKICSEEQSKNCQEDSDGSRNLYQRNSYKYIKCLRKKQQKQNNKSGLKYDKKVSYAKQRQTIQWGKKYSYVNKGLMGLKNLFLNKYAQIHKNRYMERKSILNIVNIELPFANYIRKRYKK